MTMAGLHQRCHILIFRTCEYVTLHGKKDFAGVITLMVLGWRDLLDYPGGCNIITRIIRGRQRVKSEKEKGHRSRGMQAASRSWKSQGMNSFLQSPVGTPLLFLIL